MMGRRRTYISFDFTRDHWRWKTFIHQAHDYCGFKIEDISLPQAVHNESWQREALQRIRTADVMIVLLGPDTHSTNGVKDEMGLAGQCNCPVWQIQPQKRAYHPVGKRADVVVYRWKEICGRLSTLECAITFGMSSVGPDLAALVP